MKKSFLAAFAAAASLFASAAFAEEVPTLRVAYSLSTHHEPFMAAMAPPMAAVIWS